MVCKDGIKGRQEASIRPFYWLKCDEAQASAYLEAGEYKPEIFQAREDEGFIGNGYDWASLAQVFLQEQRSDLRERIVLDAEAGALYLYCTGEDAPRVLREFLLAFVAACENEAVIGDLFSRAELD